MRLDLLRYGVLSLLALLFVSCGSKETKTTNTSWGIAPRKSELTGFTQVSEPVKIDRSAVGTAWEPTAIDCCIMVFSNW